MFFNIALIVGIILNFAAILASLILCFMSSENKYRTQVLSISAQYRWIGLVYMVLAWLVSGEIQALTNALAKIAKWMSVFSICWIAVFAISLLAKMFGKGDRKTWHILIIAIFFFVVAYLIH